MKLNELKPAHGSSRCAKRVGRGDATGHGGTSTRGHKGQRSRSGGYHKRGFEGGQTPLQRRIPKRGFNNIFKREIAVIDIGRLRVFDAGTEITPSLLFEKGLIKRIGDGLKVLGGGEIDRPLTIKGMFLSKGARAKIEAAGGTIG